LSTRLDRIFPRLDRIAFCLITSSAAEGLGVEVRRITAQSQPLENHYAGLAGLGPGNPYSEIGRRMIELLRLLPDIDGPPVWAVTSHADLHLVAGDDYRLPALVSVRGGGSGGAFSFGIEYPVPAADAPWPGARMLLGTHNTRQACEMVAYGLGRATGVSYSCRKQAEPGTAADPAS
jgi:hypothetical protein